MKRLLMLTIFLLIWSVAMAGAETGGIAPAPGAGAASIQQDQPPAAMLDADKLPPEADPPAPAGSGEIVIEVNGDAPSTPEGIHEDSPPPGSEGMVMEAGEESEGLIMEESEESSAGYIMEDTEETAENAEDVIVEEAGEAPKQE